VYRARSTFGPIALSIICGLLSAGLLVAGSLGFVLGRRDRFWWLSLTLFIYALMTTFVAFGHPRFRDASEQILVYYAALLLTRCRGHLEELRTGDVLARRRLCYGALIVLFLGLSWTYQAILRAAGWEF
jgi:hypothetical protein